MKKFDSDSIYQRLKTRLRSNGNFSVIAEDSTLNALMKTTADINSELARYVEYLLSEKKWDTAQNTSSLLAMCKMIGYKPHRKKSAIGEVIVSHDPRLTNYLTTFFDLDQLSDEDAVVATPDANATYSMTQALRPFSISTGANVSNDPWSINRGDIFKNTSSGLTYIALETKSIQPYVSAISENEIILPNFTWEGIKYLRIPVIQGIEKSISQTTGDAVVENFSIVIDSDSIEDANLDISEQFFTVKLQNIIGETYNNESYSGFWTKVESLLSCGPYDKCFEVFSSNDFSKVYVKFGDGKNGLKPSPNTQIVISYLSTSGINGNVSKRLKIDSVFPIIVDGQTGLTLTNLNKLYCINDTSVLGGTEVESLESIRVNAPLSYLRSYTISTADSYETQLKSYISGIDKIIAFSGEYIDPLTNLVKDVVYLSAIDSEGLPVLGDQGQFFLEDAVSFIGRKKSPTDTLFYKDPEIIKLRINSKVKLISRSISESEIKTTLKNSLFNKYSIFYKEFLDPFYLSDLNTSINSFPGVFSSNSYIEAVQDIDFSDPKRVSYDSSTKMFTFSFQYSPLFSKDVMRPGFKSKFDGGVPYVLRVEIVWKNSTESGNNRTFFLYDTNSSSERELDSITGLRVAQFLYIPNRVFDTAFMNNSVIPYGITPIELNYYKTDASGNELSPLTRDTRYIGGQASRISPYSRTSSFSSKAVTLDFSENHDTLDSNYEYGRISLPNTNGDNVNYLPMFDYTGTTDANLSAYLLKLKDRVSIKIYAQPRSLDLIPYLDNTMISIDKDDIIIEASYD